VSDRRKGRPRRLNEILAPAMGRLATSDEARAYALWARAAGEQVARATTARAFSRGVLTVECESSVWANELSYLSGEILARMAETDPGHPVRKLRFRVRRRAATQEEAPAVTKNPERGESLQPEDVSAARTAAEGVADERLRAAIQAALRAASGDPGGGPPAGPGRHPQK
jgi:hypothetical protein